MTDLKRSIAGVDLFADTSDPEKVERIKKALDAALKSDPAKESRAGIEALESIFGVGKVPKGPFGRIDGRGSPRQEAGAKSTPTVRVRTAPAALTRLTCL